MRLLFTLALVFSLLTPMPASFAADPAATASAARASAPISVKSFFQKPKLIVVLVVDQLRADYLTRFQSRFLPARAKDGTLGGYNYLMGEGAYFPFAQYDVLQCMTGPGHAMILSGTYPYRMGVPLNGWFDEATRERTYCVQDKTVAQVGGSVDGRGASPRLFRGNTFGDELKNAGYPSRVVTVALKDRSAILLGGHRADLALWMDSKAFNWVSSSFYLPEKNLPAWVTSLNSELDARKGKPLVWKAEGKPTGLTVSTQGFELTSTFGNKEALSWPLGIELTAGAAERALEALKLGQGPATDVLGVSFSSHDYLGHQFGPNSLEMEEMTVTEDRMLSRFLNKLRKSLPGGLKDALIVLTADHGIPPRASMLNEAKHPAGKVDDKKLTEKMEAHLIARFGKAPGGKWIIFQAELNWTFAPEALASGQVPRGVLEEEIKALALAEPGVAFAFSRTDYVTRKLPPGIFERQILKTYVPGRSGDVVAIPRAFFSTGTDAEPFDHMSGYVYDRTVPLIIYHGQGTSGAGGRVRKGVYATPADVVDIAPTLSFLTGVLAPASSEGRVLSEILVPADAP